MTWLFFAFKGLRWRYWLDFVCWYWYISFQKVVGLWFIAFNSTFNNISVISWRSVLLVEESGVPRENHRPIASHWQTLSHEFVSSTPHHEQGSNS